MHIDKEKVRDAPPKCRVAQFEGCFSFLYPLQFVSPSLFNRTAFMNSGTEAILMAIRLGRVATKKNTIVTFTGSYHGWADSVMVRMQNDGKTVHRCFSAPHPSPLQA